MPGGVRLAGKNTITEMKNRLRPTLIEKKPEKQDDHDTNEERPVNNVLPSQVAARRQPAPLQPAASTANGPPKAVSIV